MLPKADLPARVFSALYRATRLVHHTLPHWARPVAATLDLRKGYKQLFPPAGRAQVKCYHLRDRWCQMLPLILRLIVSCG